jgi:hypothetical protein
MSAALASSTTLPCWSSDRYESTARHSIAIHPGKGIVFAMNRVFGNYIEVEGSPEEYLEIQISMSSTAKEFDWQKNSICAEFVANYMNSVIFKHKDKHTNQAHGMSDAINYIANELFENSTKFNEPVSNKILSFRANKVNGTLRFYIRNSIEQSSVAPFQELIGKLLTEDLQELYLERMERVADAADQSAGLGYLSMMVDYGAKIAWKFEIIPEAPNTIFVTTMIMIEI